MREVQTSILNLSRRLMLARSVQPAREVSNSSKI